MKKLLITNCGWSEMPLILAAKRQGYHVISLGNNPMAYGRNHVDEYYPVDFSDINEAYNIAKFLKIDAVCSSANDFGIITASYIAEKLKLGGHDPYETTLMLHHKDKFKELVKHCPINTVDATFYHSMDELPGDIDRFDYPVIVKPIDLSGGKGVSIVRDKKDLEGAVKLAFTLSRVKRVVVEKFFEGTQHSMTTFLRNKKVVFTFTDNEYSYHNPFLVSTSAGPATNIELVRDKLIADSEKIASYLNLVDGIFHIQYLQNGEDVSIIEITRRCSGDLYPYPVNQAAGIVWEDWIVKAETGQDCSDFPQAKQTGFVGRHCLMAPCNGVVDDIILSPQIKDNIVSEMLWWNNGYVITDFMQQKLGIYVLKYSTESEMLEKTKNITELFRVVVR